MGSLLAALTTLIVTVLAALLAAPYVLDWNQYKHVFEDQAAKMTGRAVRIEGRIDMTILPVPEVRLTGLRVADEAGSFKRPFAEAETFKMVLSLPALLSGTIEARQMDLGQPVLRFELDEVGSGNWTTLGAGAGGALVPARGMVLHNVTIRDGAVEYRNAPDDAAPSRIDQISGSFAADSFNGPFRFTGIGAIGRDRRELKFSAGRVQNGATRIKASIGSPAGGTLYQLDGDLKNLSGAMQYTGPVLARLEMGLPTGGKGDKQVAAARPKAVELRAASTITLQDARLQDIALTVTENDRPQSFTGSAFAAWGDQPRLDLSIQTAYLDIDQMVGSAGKGDKAKANPLDAVAVLPRIFEGWAFEPRSGKIKASIQQANLGGDIIENVTFSASHDREYWQVETLEARLPGEGALSIRGVMRPGDKIGFTGEFDLSGKHLSRLLRWTAPGLGAVDTGDAQQFSLKGGLTYADERFTLRKTAGQLGDSSFSGDLAYDFSTESKLVLTLESKRLDLRTIYGDGNPFAGMTAEAQAEAAAREGQAPGKMSLVDAFRSVFAAKQSQFNLNIAQLTMPDFEAKDVRSVFRYDSGNGTLDIREFNLATTEGLSVKADGMLTALGAAPSGSVNLAVNAPAVVSLANLAKIVGLESFSPAARRRMEALAPLRLSGRVIGNRGERALTLTLAGNAAGSELTLSGRLDGDLNALREAKVDFGGTIANADGRRLIAQLASDAPLPAEANRAPGAGVLTVSAQGQMRAGLESRLELRTPEAEGRFEGQFKPLDDHWGLKGALWLRAGQASTALAMLRLAPGGSPVTGDIDLRATLTKSAAKFQVEDVILQLAGQRVTGSASIDLGGERPVADIEARAGAVSLPKLAAYLVDWDRRDGGPTTINLTGNAAPENPWPNQSFAFRSFGAVEGKLRLKAQSIGLMDNLSITDGQFDAALKDRMLRVEALKGQLYGGAFSAGATLAAVDGRVVLNGNLRLDKADLTRLTATSGPGGKPLARGSGDFRLAFAGEGLSPRGLLTVLSGKGRVKMSKGILYGLQPGVLGQAGDAYLLEEVPQQNRLMARITRDLRAPQAQLPYRGFIAPVVLKDGVIEIPRAGFKSPDALATANLLVDLQSMKLDSEWSVAWRGKTRVASSLAPVRMVFAGPVPSFTTLQPQLSTEAFERALAAQRMDREMEKLEKLAPPAPPASGPWQPSTPPASHEQMVAPQAAPSSNNGTITGATGPQAQPNPAIPTQPTAAPPQPSGGQGQWSTGVEDAAPATRGARPIPPGKPPADFEEEIRRVLQEQQQKASQEQPGVPPTAPASPQPTPRSSLSYQTQSYSQSGAEDESGNAAEPEVSAEAAPPPSAVPVPQRRTDPPPRKAKPANALEDLLGLFQ